MFGASRPLLPPLVVAEERNANGISSERAVILTAISDEDGRGGIVQAVETLCTQVLKYLVHWQLVQQIDLPTLCLFFCGSCIRGCSVIHASQPFLVRGADHGSGAGGAPAAFAPGAGLDAAVRFIPRTHGSTALAPAAYRDHVRNLPSS